MSECGVDRELGEIAQDARVVVVEPSPASGPRTAFITDAIANVRRTVSPARPIPCASDDVIGMTPRSCSTSSAAIVEARTRSWASAAHRQLRPQPVDGDDHRPCSAIASRP